MTSPPGSHPSDSSTPGAMPPLAPPAEASLVGGGWAPTLATGLPSSDPQPAKDEPARDEPASTPTPTTVLPAALAEPRRTAPVRPQTRPSSPRSTRPTDSGHPATKNRRARLALQRVDPWSVFVYSLLASVFLGIALVVAAGVLYAVLGQLGVPDTINQLYREVTGGDAGSALLSASRVMTGATVVGAINVVLITLLSTLVALLYNLCASFTGGIEVTLGERDS